LETLSEEIASGRKSLDTVLSDAIRSSRPLTPFTTPLPSPVEDHHSSSRQDQ
jgi:hypothetical protein